MHAKHRPSAGARTPSKATAVVMLVLLAVVVLGASRLGGHGDGEHHGVEHHTVAALTADERQHKHHNEHHKNGEHHHHDDGDLHAHHHHDDAVVRDAADSAVEGDFATLHTEFGPIEWELHGADAPQTVANFKKIVASGFHNASCMYRYEPGFVLQGGGCGGRCPSRLKAPLEYKLPNAKHTVAIARTDDRNSGGSEFFINLGDNTRSLGPLGGGGGYAVFATVVSGFATMDAMAKLATHHDAGLRFFDKQPRIQGVTFASQRAH
jgi:cyclophilin family peptidyl-prolyl cis-trans isomerase